MPLVQFCVNSYTNNSLPISAQRALNLYAEKEPPDTKTPVALLGVPGISSFATVGSGPIRQVHTISTSGYLYVVSGAELYGVSNTGVVELIGNVGSPTGPVQMSDNGYQLVILNNGQSWVYANELLALPNNSKLTDTPSLLTNGALITTLSQGVSTSVALDAIGTNSISGSLVTSISYNNITVGTGSNRALLVLVIYDGTPTSPSVIWDFGGTNQGLELIGEASNSSAVAQLYGLVNPISGNKVLYAQNLTTTSMIVSAISFTGVNQTGGPASFANFTVNSGATEEANITVASNFNDMVVGNAVFGSNWVSVNNSQIYLDNSLISKADVVTGIGNYASGEDSVTLSGINDNAGTAWAYAAVDIVASPSTNILNVSYINTLLDFNIGDNIVVDLDNGGQLNSTITAPTVVATITLSGPGPVTSAAKGNTVNDVTTAGANTLLANPATLGSPIFKVQATLPMLIGDIIQVELDNGQNYTGTLLATTQAQITIADSLPSSASTGNEVANTSAHLFQVNDPNFYPAQTITYFDDYFVLDRFGTDEFFLSAIGDGSTYPPLYFASAEVNPDNVIAVFVDHEMLLVFGAKTIETWYDAGTANFPFQRYDGATVQRGLIAAQTIVQEDNAIFFLSDDKIFYRLQGVLPIRISTHAIESAWGKYSTVTDAIAFSYTLNGHKFIHLIFPSGPGTFIFDISTGLWHERDSYDANGNLLGRWRVNCMCQAYGKTIVGDLLSGQIGFIDNSVYTEFGSTIIGQGTGAPIRSNRSRIFMPKFELEVQAGAGVIGNLPNIITLNANLPTIVLIGGLVTDVTSGAETTITVASLGNTISVVSTMGMAIGNTLNITLGTKIVFTTTIKFISTPSNPQIYLDYSDDGGYNYSTPQMPRPLGASGQYNVRQRWLRLGQSRLRYMRITITDPVPRVIIAAYASTYEGLGI